MSRSPSFRRAPGPAPLGPPSVALLTLLIGVALVVGGAGATSPSGAARPAVWPGTGEGKSPAELFPWARFDPAIPTQAEVVGFEPGSRPIRHAELMRWLRALDQASPRAELRTYASSHEGRELVYLAIADPETIARLDAFRDEHAARVDPRRGAGQELAGAHAVAWLAYGIHGDELSSVDAAAAVAYWLVAGEDELAQRIRRELVVLVDPIENPDGRERFLAQTLSFACVVPNPDSDDISHTTVWPWGRGNHYLFDLNRDWFSMVQPESRRSAVIADWNPQLVVDSHEMGSHDTYLFSPPRAPFNPHLPRTHRGWGDRFAAEQARALDERGYGYYTGEWNEEFFPGYGSSWASYLGAVGILYEMSSTEGTLVRQRSGTLRTYPQAVEHQTTSSVANLRTLLQEREAILRDFVADRRAAMTLLPGGAWILPRGRHPERTDALARLLIEQNVEVLRSNDGCPRLRGARDARTGTATEPPAETEGCFLVPLDQPAAPLVRALLDPHVPMEGGFFREEREHLERDRGTRLYETTAWSLPLAWGVEAWWTTERPRAGFGPAEPVAAARGRVEGPAAGAYGWLFEGTSDGSAFALADLLQRGIAVRVAEKPFRVAGVDYDRGAVLVPREGPNEALDDLTGVLSDVAEARGVVIRAAGTAKAESGPDLGGSHFPQLRAPRVGIWTGTPVSPAAYGALWHLFDHELRMRFSGLDLSRFGAIDLERYNVLIFPPVFGEAGTYGELLGEDGIERLETWIAAGGTAIGIGEGAEFLADRELELTATRLRRQALEEHPPVVLGPSVLEVVDAGPFHALGLRTPPTEEEEETPNGSRAAGGRARTAEPPRRTSLYDVAPILGQGARPFAEGHEQGTAVTMEPVSLVDWLAPLLPPGRSEPTPEELERADERLRRFAPQGAFLRIELDPERWLAWGLPGEMPALVRADDALVAAPPVEVPARFAGLERLHLGGLLWPEAAGRLAHTAYLTREGHGRGQIVLFASDPAFRGQTLGTRRLLLNALLYGPGLGTTWSHPW